jgi:hypothetical protein
MVMGDHIMTRSGQKVAILISVVLAAGLLNGTESARGAERFVLEFNGEAVRDTKTGLIWEREPDREHDIWSRSLTRCATKEVGGQKGWRPPTIEEIKTLVDLDQNDPSLPPDHPFIGIRSEIYWTSTPHPTDDIVAWQQSFLSGQAVTDQKSGMRRLWCVLGK